MNKYYFYDYNINISCIYQNGNPYKHSSSRTAIPIKSTYIAGSDYKSDPHLRWKAQDKEEV